MKDNSRKSRMPSGRWATALLLLACTAGMEAAEPGTKIPETADKTTVKVKSKVDIKVGEKGKVGGAVDTQGNEEASVGYGPITEKITDAGVEVEAAVGVKLPVGEVKAKAAIKGGINRDEKTDFYPEGVPSLKVSGAVGVEASAGVGPVKASVGASRTVFSQKLDPLNFRGTNDRLTETLKAAGGEEYQVQEPSRPDNRTVSPPPKPRTAQQIMDENARLEAELKKVSADLVKDRKAPPPDAPGADTQSGQATAPASSPTVAANATGWLDFNKPANIDSGTWALYVDAFKKELGGKPYIREIRPNGDGLTMRYDGISEPDLQELEKGFASFLSVRRDAQAAGSGTKPAAAPPPRTAAAPDKSAAPAKPMASGTSATKPTAAPSAKPAGSPGQDKTPHDGYWFDPQDRSADDDDPCIYVRVNGLVERMPLSEAIKRCGVPDDATIDRMSHYSERQKKVLIDRGTHRSKSSGKFAKPKG
jgi:hypothetical protein